MLTSPALTFLSPPHLTVLALIVALPLAFAWVTGCDPDANSTRAIAWALFGLLALNKIASLIYIARHGFLSLQNALPMHLCDWATILTAASLVTRWRLGYELAYFWGLAGTCQAVLTPDLDAEFPDFRFISFFVSHGGVIVAVLFMTFSMRLRPRHGAVLRAMIWINVYLVVTLAVNTFLRANYGYLCAKPEHPSLMDYLGPWPWYLLSLEALALLYFVVLYLPFFIGDRLRRRFGE